jgi:hypothetical protein
MNKPAKEQFEAAARAHRWEYSAAHGGWIHPEEYDPERGYAIQSSAEDACWLHEIDVRASHDPRPTR